MDDKLRNKIQSLLAKAQNEASTEAEVLAAMAAAKKLLSKNGMSEDDLQTIEIVEDFSLVLTGRSKDVGKMVATSIALYTNTHAVQRRDRRRRQSVRIGFIGRKHDVEFALFILGMLTDTITRWSKQYDPSLLRPERRLSPAGRSKERNDYAKGIALTVSNRLGDLSEGDQRDDDQSLKAYMDKRNLTRGRGLSINVSQAFNKGLSDGDEINLNRPLNENKAAKKLLE